MSAIDNTVLSAYPGVEEVAGVVGAVGACVTLVVGGVGETFAGAECDVEGGSCLVFDANVSSGVW